MTAVATVAQLDQFDEIIDVRTPPEFREDHIPGAVNFPVLTEQERERVGTIYKQVSSFEAKKIGAVLIARNIARHVEDYFAAKPKNWRPLIYRTRGLQAAARCGTWNNPPGSAARCWATCPMRRNRRKKCSIAKSGIGYGISIRPSRCMWKRRAKKSANCACPMR